MKRGSKKGSKKGSKNDPKNVQKRVPLFWVILAIILPENPKSRGTPKITSNKMTPKMGSKWPILGVRNGSKKGLFWAPFGDPILGVCQGEPFK